MHPRARDPEKRGQDLEYSPVGGAVDGRGGELQLQTSLVHARDFVAPRPGLNENLDLQTAPSFEELHTTVRRECVFRKSRFRYGQA